jgi:hypothetical protein
MLVRACVIIVMVNARRFVGWVGGWCLHFLEARFLERGKG